MPLKIRERPPRKFNVVKPRNIPTTEKQGMNKTPGTIPKETLNSLSKRSAQSGKDVGGRSGWRAPSDIHHSAPQIDDTMNKNYEDHFFKINKGHNRGSVNPRYKMRSKIDASQFFK